MPVVNEHNYLYSGVSCGEGQKLYPSRFIWLVKRLNMRQINRRKANKRLTTCILLYTWVRTRKPEELTRMVETLTLNTIFS